MSEASKEWNLKEFDRNDLDRLVQDVKIYTPVIIVGKPRTGKSILCNIIKEELGKVLYVDERDNDIYNKYFKGGLDDNLELFTDLCDSDCENIIIDGYTSGSNLYDIIHLARNNNLGVVVTTHSLNVLAEAGVSLDEYTIVELDYDNGNFVYNIR